MTTAVDTPERQPDLRTLSLGAGVQSTTMYLLAVKGEIGPKPDAAIFADTQAEPPWVYEHLDRLEREHGHVIPIHRVSVGDIVEHSFGGVKGRRAPRPPVFIDNPDGSFGMLPRQCTLTFKIEPIKAETRRLLGLKRGQHMGKRLVEEWVGISTDEAHRMKPSRFLGFVTRWPLIEARMSRNDCTRWLQRNAFDVPKKSACYFCPFHGDATWLDLKRTAPEVFEQACQYDDAMRARGLSGVKGTAYLHKTRKPLREVDFNEGQLSLGGDGWGNECEGRCGV